MVMITETEELEVTPRTIRSETIEEILGETMEESVEETMEETVEEQGGNHRSIIPAVSHSPKPRMPSRIMTRKSHIVKMCEWLFPYLIAVVLVIGIGGMVMLTSYFRTQQLYKQLYEQYGEYLADE